ncbi:hypothetical protein ACO0LG_17755 [Undibacterium sp. Ji42W]|uniref:hypothetical protein n=1 Tax=Undibacterium sp. Ji42W TaxID=3413039 RepID=UPI003BF326C1
MAELIKHDAVSKLEECLRHGPQIDLNTEHCLSGGMYARTIHIPAGTVLVGTTHKKDHLNVVCGDISVSTDDGMRRITGYCVLPTKAGMKRVGFAHADTVWTTVCRTDLLVIEEIEDELVVQSDQLQTRKSRLAMEEVNKLEK